MDAPNHIPDLPPGHIRYLQRTQIDTGKWDACIRGTPGGLIYARSFFLDAMTRGQWDGLVLDDYAAVMPLTWKKKFGFTYLCQPHYCAMLGLFGLSPLTDFLAAIPRRFKLWDIDLNENNSTVDPSVLPVRTRMRINYFLALDSPYDTLSAQYKRLARRMLQKANAAHLSIARGVDPDLVIDGYRKAYGHAPANRADDPFRRLTSCAATALATGQAATYLARRPDGAIVAFYLVFSDDRFVYSVLGGSTAGGKEDGAFYMLTDAVIRDHCATHRIFRFEGSDIPGIAFFNRQFGSYPIPYPHLVLNRLPFPVNIFKPL
jgi:hypothetical protein